MNGLFISLASLLALISASASAQSLEEYVSSNAALSDNVEARMLVKEQSAMMAFKEAMSEGGGNTHARKAELLTKDGSKYGELSIKKLKKFCAGDARALDITDEPDNDTCAFLRSIK